MSCRARGSFGSGALLVLSLLASSGCGAGGGSQDAGGAGAGGGGGSSGVGDLLATNGTGFSEPPCSATAPDGDADGDGFTVVDGDCNDCTPLMNPGAADYPGNGADEDCSGAADDAEAACDGSLSIASADPRDAARALGICAEAKGRGFGLVDAAYVTANGKPLEDFDPAGIGHGILARFGDHVNPQEGKKLLALSSGAARTPDDPGYQAPAGHDKGYTTAAPPGYPKESTSCPDTDVQTGPSFDSAGLRLVLRTPTNARSFRFNLNFYTYEYPVFVCDQYNDYFVALLSPPPPAQPDGNVSFDAQGNTISVNAGFLEVCHPGNAGGKEFPCKFGPKELLGTGFELDDNGDPVENSGATGWLETRAPVLDPGGEITLHFAVWDSGDGRLDSTVLLDNFAFDLEEAEAGTDHVPVPK